MSRIDGSRKADADGQKCARIDTGEGTGGSRVQIEAFLIDLHAAHKAGVSQSKGNVVIT